MALTLDPEQLIEATVQFIGVGPSVSTFFKVIADLFPSHWGCGQNVSRGGHVQIEAVCVIRNIAHVLFGNGGKLSELDGFRVLDFPVGPLKVLWV